MTDPVSNSDALYAHIIENSIFTSRQISIISNQLKGSGRPENISSGAYYRQVKQCKKKVNSILYSMILLQSIGIVKADASMTLSRVSEQLSVIFSLGKSSDVTLKAHEEDVMFVINEVIKRVSAM